MKIFRKKKKNFGIKPKYKVGQEVWRLYMMQDQQGNYHKCTEKHKITYIDENGCRIPSARFVYFFNGKNACTEEEMFLNEKEAAFNGSKGWLNENSDIFMTGKNCWKSELKYFEREEKLKRILDGD